MKIKYTSEDYKNMIERFCGEKGYTDKQSAFLIRPCVYEKDLFNLDPQEYLDLVIKDMCGKSKNAQYLLENRSYISQFLGWAVTNNYIEMNPFEKLSILSYTSMVEIQSEYVNLDILYPEDIREIVKNIPQNKDYYSMLIYGFYGGIRNAKEFASIKTTDIDLDNNTIKLKDRIFHGSEILFSHIRAYMKETEYRVSKTYPNSQKIIIDILELVKVGDYLIKDKLSKNRDWKEHLDNIDINKYERILQTRISRDFCEGLPKLFKIYDLDDFSMSIDQVNKSGFINFARHKLYNYSDYDFCELFVGSDDYMKKEWCKILEDCAKEFGEPSKGHAIRRKYRLHILSSKYYK